MMKLGVYVCLVEVAPLAGCDLDPTEYKGAMARCYVLAVDETNAIVRLRRSLERDRFQLVAVEWCVNRAEVEWEKPNAPDALRCVAKARTTGEVVYGRFDGWGHDGADAFN